MAAVYLLHVTVWITFGVYNIGCLDFLICSAKKRGPKGGCFAHFIPRVDAFMPGGYVSTHHRNEDLLLSLRLLYSPLSRERERLACMVYKKGTAKAA